MNVRMFSFIKNTVNYLQFIQLIIDLQSLKKGEVPEWPKGHVC
jgi:hypothetical protein